MICTVCATPLTEKQVVIAESRGMKALYCSHRCRRTAAGKRRASARKAAKA
ncbi:MAG: hypothetical protein ACYDCJ_13695 [Gammaproteobacteria bacterium]